MKETCVYNGYQKSYAIWILNTPITNALTLLRMGEGAKKAPSTSFSRVTSTNVEMSPQNFLTLSFNPFATLVLNFKLVSSASPKLLNLNQDHPLKKRFFW